MIDAAAIPVVAGDMAALTGHARAVSTAGSDFGEIGARVHTTWQGLDPRTRGPA